MIHQESRFIFSGRRPGTTLFNHFPARKKAACKIPFFLLLGIFSATFSLSILIYRFHTFFYCFSAYFGIFRLILFLYILLIPMRRNFYSSKPKSQMILNSEYTESPNQAAATLRINKNILPNQSPIRSKPRLRNKYAVLHLPESGTHISGRAFSSRTQPSLFQ